MIMKQFLTKAALALMAAALPAAASAEAIEGHWTNPKHTVIVRVAPCGPAFCGTVTWASAKAKRKTGDELVGMQLMTGFTPDGSGAYKGRVFEPRHDLRGTGTIRLVGRNTMVIKGCAIAGLLCKEQRWTRIS
jgi:uncharacterized protein (DUF2147 family)